MRRMARRRVAVLGGGHGVAVVLRALRHHELDLTVIVTVADDGGSSGELRRRLGTPAVGDMRRALVALIEEQDRAGFALGARVTMDRFGEHPLGNLMLCSLFKAFGSLEAAGEWLTGELGLSARVLPATTHPVSLVATSHGSPIRGESAIGAAPGRIESLGFEPERPDVPRLALDALCEADWVLIGPGSLFTSVLAVSALPDIRTALARTGAQVLWICNLAPQVPETAGMSAGDHLAALHRHGVRIDTVLHDPAAGLRLTQPEVAAFDVRDVARPMVSASAGRHDPALLSEALAELFSMRPVLRS
ncbi:MAG TPA: uridine diphosphate-N-acetylglucosamine-binding protein YvcK [Solirubrobacteraceae bacterium]|nr:uridine diphosphate-N-acetylglucosamine-binding protein YvcK [Solirubrobacteraceae bacterium]